MQVLVVEDSAVYRKLICDQLKGWGFTPCIAESGAAAWTMLEQPNAPNLVLLDWVLPDLDGTELCRRIRESASTGPYVYVILLTSNEGQQNMLEAMQAGVDDYLVKPFDESELRARLLVGKRIVNLQQELVSARESMRHAATHDSLTGLLNRGEVLGMMQRELERARRQKKTVAVILADIDHFKKVNDTLGHLYGDEALKEIARRLRAKLRMYDGIGRYGGEEFLLVLPECDMASAMGRANQLREFVASEPVVHGDKKRTITISMGIAVSNASGTGEMESLLGKADAALYAAKEKGRNRIEPMADAEEKKTRARGRG
ncbi:MAG TPA: diguanylate cyclase [Terriglobales bacterium]|nr:diguanylate cyclase [Terriglobales bacterium]